MSVEVLSVSPVRVKNRPTVRMRWALPEEVGLVFEVKAQQQAVEGYAPDPPASLHCAVFAVLGELQYLQAGLSVVTETEEAPQG